MRYFYWEWGFRLPWGRFFYVWAEPTEHFSFSPVPRIEIGWGTLALTVWLVAIQGGIGISRELYPSSY